MNEELLVQRIHDAILEAWDVTKTAKEGGEYPITRASVIVQAGDDHRITYTKKILMAPA